MRNRNPVLVLHSAFRIPHSAFLEEFRGLGSNQRFHVQSVTCSRYTTPECLRVVTDPGRTRTGTLRGLSAPPLPLGHRAEYGGKGSNLHGRVQSPVAYR
jgi:hypothetical protein